MTLWIAWSVIVSALIGLAATAVDRAAAVVGGARRWVWLGAMVCAASVPLVAAIPRTFARSEVVFAPTPPPIRAPASTKQAPILPIRIAGAAPVTDEATSAPAGIAPAVHARRVWDRITPRVPEIVRALDRWVAAAWLTASATLLMIFAGTMLRLRRQRARWHDAELGPCRALVAPDAGPAVIGFARPRIVVPTWVLSLDEPARSLLLRHEMEHIQAGDPRVVLAAGALVVVFPWNAVLWWMLARLRLAIEMDCDTRVVRAVGGARDYGLVLLAVGARRTVPLAFAAPLTEARPNLERRINAMTTPRPERPLLASLPFVALATLAMTAASWAPRPDPLREAGSPRVAAQPVTANAVGTSVLGGITRTVVPAHPAASPDSTQSPAPKVIVRTAPPLAVVPARDSGQAVHPHGEVLLDSALGQGRSRPGLRVDAVRFRSNFDGIIGNPFVPILVVANDLSLSASQTDSVVASLARFERLSDSEWTSLAAYLAGQPDDYDIDAVWNRWLGAADSIIEGMLADGAALKGTLTSAQLARVPVPLRSFLEPKCATFFHQRVVSGLHTVPRATGGIGLATAGGRGGGAPLPMVCPGAR